ncbi:MAG: ABC transporter permease, partial [Candidatus Cloacimonetes bacterium]|nr:ABC transporter permease [Candidatus Cloacimonadota bacterium]
MLKNYFKIALRNIIRHKGFSFSNIFGLAIGIAACLLISLWVQDELNYDKFHQNSENIFQMIQTQY